MQNSKNASEYFVLFKINDSTYGIRSTLVQQMEMIENITPVPDAPKYVEGIVFLRGQVIPVINLRIKFGYEKIPYDLKTRLIVVKATDRSVGLIVDMAREFIHIPSNTIIPPPEDISDSSKKYLEGVVSQKDKMILLLNVEELIKVEGQVSFDKQVS